MLAADTPVFLPYEFHHERIDKIVHTLVELSVFVALDADVYVNIAICHVPKAKYADQIFLGPRH